YSAPFVHPSSSLTWSRGAKVSYASHPGKPHGQIQRRHGQKEHAKKTDPTNLLLIGRFPQKHLRASQGKEPATCWNCDVDVRHDHPFPCTAPADQHTRSRWLCGGHSKILTSLIA